MVTPLFASKNNHHLNQPLILKPVERNKDAGGLTGVLLGSILKLLYQQN